MEENIMKVFTLTTKKRDSINIIFESDSGTLELCSEVKCEILKNIDQKLYVYEHYQHLFSKTIEVRVKSNMNESIYITAHSCTYFDSFQQSKEISVEFYEHNRNFCFFHSYFTKIQTNKDLGNIKFDFFQFDGEVQLQKYKEVDFINFIELDFQGQGYVYFSINIEDESQDFYKIQIVEEEITKGEFKLQQSKFIQGRKLFFINNVNNNSIIATSQSGLVFIKQSNEKLGKHYDNLGQLTKPEKTQSNYSVIKLQNEINHISLSQDQQFIICKNKTEYLLFTTFITILPNLTLLDLDENKKLQIFPNQQNVILVNTLKYKNKMNSIKPSYVFEVHFENEVRGITQFFSQSISEFTTMQRINDTLQILIENEEKVENQICFVILQTDVEQVINFQSSTTYQIKYENQYRFYEFENGQKILYYFNLSQFPIEHYMICISYAGYEKLDIQAFTILSSEKFYNPKNVSSETTSHTTYNTQKYCLTGNSSKNIISFVIMNNVSVSQNFLTLTVGKPFFFYTQAQYGKINNLVEFGTTLQLKMIMPFIKSKGSNIIQSLTYFELDLNQPLLSSAILKISNSLTMKVIQKLYLKANTTIISQELLLPMDVELIIQLNVENGTLGMVQGSLFYSKLHQDVGLSSIFDQQQPLIFKLVQSKKQNQALYFFNNTQYIKAYICEGLPMLALFNQRNCSQVQFQNDSYYYDYDVKPNQNNYLTVICKNDLLTPQLLQYETVNTVNLKFNHHNTIFNKQNYFIFDLMKIKQQNNNIYINFNQNIDILCIESTIYTWNTLQCNNKQTNVSKLEFQLNLDHQFENRYIYVQSYEKISFNDIFLTSFVCEENLKLIKFELLEAKRDDANFIILKTNKQMLQFQNNPDLSENEFKQAFDNNELSKIILRYSDDIEFSNFSQDDTDAIQIVNTQCNYILIKLVQLKKYSKFVLTFTEVSIKELKFQNPTSVDLKSNKPQIFLFRAFQTPLQWNIDVCKRTALVPLNISSSLFDSQPKINKKHLLENSFSLKFPDQQNYNFFVQFQSNQDIKFEQTVQSSSLKPSIPRDQQVYVTVDKKENIANVKFRSAGLRLDFDSIQAIGFKSKFIKTISYKVYATNNYSTNNVVDTFCGLKEFAVEQSEFHSFDQKENTQLNFDFQLKIQLENNTKFILVAKNDLTGDISVFNPVSYEIQKGTTINAVAIGIGASFGLIAIIATFVFIYYIYNFQKRKQQVYQNIE